MNPDLLHLGGQLARVWQFWFRKTPSGSMLVVGTKAYAVVYLFCFFHKLGVLPPIIFSHLTRVLRRSGLCRSGY